MAIERIMAEAPTVPQSVAEANSAKAGQTSVISTEAQQRFKKGWNISKEYDAQKEARGEYVLQDDGEYQIAIDPVTGKEVKRVLKRVLENAKRSDEERLQKAREGLKEALTPKLEQGVLKAHAVGVEKPGKYGGEAGVYNYTQAQIAEKARILKESGATKEQRHWLMKEGLVGVMPELLRTLAKKPSLFEDADEVIEATLNLTDEDWQQIQADPETARQIAEQVKIWNEILGIEEGGADPAKITEYAKDREKVLTYVKKEIQRTYVEAMSQLPTSRSEEDYWGSHPAPKTISDKKKMVREALRNYEESFWDYGSEELEKTFKTTNIARLKKTFKGVAKYCAARAAVAIEKRLLGVPLSRGRKEIGDAAVNDVIENLELSKDRDEQIRREQRKRVTRKERLPYNSWREKFEFTWAETPEELRDTVHDWLDWFREQLPDEAEQTVFESINTGRHNAIASLERALNNLGIRPENPIAKELRATIEAHVAVIGGVRLLESGKEGFEAYTKFLEDFAKNFNEHHDSIYLGNAKSAIIQDFLSESEHLISLGGPDNINKPLAGDTEDYREKLEELAKQYAATHELYIRESDFEEVKGTRYGWNDSIEELLLVDQRDIDKANQISDPAQKAAALAKIDLRTQVFKNIKDRLDKEDITIEEKKAGEIQGLYGLTGERRRDRIRKRIRTEMDKRGGQTRGLEVDAIDGQITVKFRQAFEAGIAKLNLSPADAERAIDARMAEPKVQQAIQKQVTELKDKALWQWVEDYNKIKEDKSRNGWFPSSWDKVRLSIKKSTKLLDRVLTKEEFKAMVEEVSDPYQGLTADQIREKFSMEFGLTIQKDPDVQKLSPVDLQEEYNRRLQRIIFRLEQGRAEAESAFNINRAYQKFLGVDARWGGLTARKVDVDGKLKLVTIYSEASKILKAKIEKEEAGVKEKVRQWKINWLNQWNTQGKNEWLLGYVATHPGLSPEDLNKAITKQKYILENTYKKDTPEQIETRLKVWKLGYVATHPGASADQLKEAEDKIIKEAEIKEERLLRRDCTFAAALGLREIGIAYDLPIWNYHYYGDVSQIGAFAPLVGYTDDEKGELVELLDRGRREMEAVFNFMTEQHMDGKILVVKDTPGAVIEETVIEDGVEKKVQKEAHEESKVRSRVINEGGELTLRDLFECRFMISTSGGIEIPDLISKIGDLGVNDFLWEMGCQDFREFQGFIKRRDEVDLKEQSFLNTRKWGDPVSWVKRIKGAFAARTLLVGGEVQGQGYQPGPLNELMDGAWLLRDEFFSPNKWNTAMIAKLVGGVGLKNKKGQDVNKDTPEGKEAFIAAMQKILENPESTKDLGIVATDSLVKTGGGILKYLINFMNSRRYLENRAGRAPKNWKYDNELIARAYFAELAKRAAVIARPGDLLSIDKATGNPIYAKGGEVLAGVGGEVLGGDRLAYAVQGRSETAIRVFTAILRGSTYHTLSEEDRRALDGRAERTRAAMGKMRKDLMAGVMSNTDKTSLDTKIEELRTQKVGLKKAAEALGILELNDKDQVDIAKINAWKQAKQTYETSEADMMKFTNEAVMKELTDREQAGNLSLEDELLLKTIRNRKERLEAVNTTEGNQQWEMYRLINQEIDTRLHMGFVGEWSARLVA